MALTKVGSTSDHKLNPNRYRRSVSGNSGSKSTKMESISISIPIAIWIPMKPIQIDGELGGVATNRVSPPVPRTWRGKLQVGCQRL
jgi:hypothetical protein